MVRGLFTCLQEEILFMEKRSLIEDVFKTAKNTFGLRKIHKYTTKSVKTTIYLNILLLGLVISLGIDKKNWIFRGSLNGSW